MHHFEQMTALPLHLDALIPHNPPLSLSKASPHASTPRGSTSPAFKRKHSALQKQNTPSVQLLAPAVIEILGIFFAIKVRLDVPFQSGRVRKIMLRLTCFSCKRGDKALIWPSIMQAPLSFSIEQIVCSGQISVEIPFKVQHRTLRAERRKSCIISLEETIRCRLCWRRPD